MVQTLVTAAVAALLTAISILSFSGDGKRDSEAGRDTDAGQADARQEQPAPDAIPADPESTYDANDRAMIAFLTSVSGHWKATLPIPGNEDRVLNIWFRTEAGPTKDSMILRTSLRSAGPWKFHGLSLIWRELDGTWRLTQVLEDHSAGAGTVVMLSPDHLRMQWRPVLPSGQSVLRYLDLKQADDDNMTFTVHNASDPANLETMMTVQYERGRPDSATP